MGNGVSQSVALRTTCVGCPNYRDTTLDFMENACAVQADAIYAEGITLVPEDDNEFDPNAVLVRYNGRDLGHVAGRDTQKARMFLELFSPDQKLSVRITEFRKDEEFPDCLKWFSMTIKVAGEA